MSCPCGCGCCEGTEAITPRVIFNRPGLPALHWRVGEYADFLETMRSRISTVWVDIDTGELDAHGEPRKQRWFPLRDLRTRATDDDTTALLDLWAVVGEILSFYSERIAGEGFLRTAGELRSVSELARLVGYRRRPGVAASVFLAFTADDSWTKPLVVPAGARVQSMPEPGEPPVIFETGADLAARALWNVLEPRRTRPTYLPPASGPKVPVLYLAGTATRLAPNDLLALSYDDDADEQVLRRVAATEVDYTAQRTCVTLRGDPIARAKAPKPVNLDDLVSQLERPPSVPPATPARLSLSAQQTFGPGSPAADGLLIAFHPAIADGFTQARANATVSPPIPLQAVSAFRVRASIYGSLALLQPVHGDASPADWPYAYPVADDDLKLRTIDLDAVYDGIVPGDWVVVEKPGVGDHQALITRVTAVDQVSRTDYNLIAKVTRLTLEEPWLHDPVGDDVEPLQLADLRSTKVYASPELLPQAEEPIDGPVCGAEIELAGQVDGLQPGRWLIVTGERAVSAPQPGSPGDAFSAPGVSATEVVMLAGVRQDTLRIDGNQVVASAGPGKGDLDPLPGDRIHTFLQLTNPLSYCYRRDTLRIYANVAHATHGETHEEPLGSGDPGEAFQSFTLKSRPVTYVSAPTTTGVESSLAVYVNDVRWREAANRLDLGPADRGYLTFADQDEKTTVTFGDGTNGARLPRGVENVRAVYRSGIGAAGNVRPGQLSQLVTRTEGLREVVNPERASGGADPEGIDSTRARAPLAVAALDRLVATRDYADFALRFAGIGKASAARLPSSHGHLVYVTVAGEDDIPIDPGSDLQRNLVAALERFGDPDLPVRVASRELLALVIAAAVKLDADHVWEVVRPQLEAALHACFGFAHRELAQDAYAAEAIAAMQAVDGVDYVDLTLFAAVSEKATIPEIATLGTTLSGVRQRIPALPARPGSDPLAPLAAQLVALLASPTTTVMLSEIPDA